MKKRILRMLAALLCMMLATMPIEVLAAERVTLEMKVGESKKLDVGVTTAFSSANQSVAVVSQDGYVMAKQEGKARIYAYLNSDLVGSWEVIVGSGKTPQRPKNTGGWPFVPSPINKTNGIIKSGWYLIITHDLGQFYVSESGMVTPTRRTQSAFYIEHLGNDIYYIYDENGRYLSCNGDPEHGSWITVSKTPRKWNIYMNYDWQKRYIFRANKDDDLVIASFGDCSETEDSMVRLTWQPRLSSNVDGKAQFTLENSGIDNYIPQWYKDFENGLDKPSTTEKPKVFGAVPSELKYTTKEEWEVLRLTNVERAKNGLYMLVTTNSMQKAAGIRSDELLQSYSHTRPNGSEPYTVFDSVGIYEKQAAENIALNFGSPKNVVDSWMNSKGHRYNILYPGLRYMGSGMSYGKEAGWEQIFATTSNSDCSSISYNEEMGYFTLKLKNGTTAYAPYNDIYPPDNGDYIAFNYPGASNISGTPQKPIESSELNEGWYNLRTMYNYLNFTSNGYAELRKLEENEAFYVETAGDGLITLKNGDGLYLGLNKSLKNGVQACLVETPYKWTIYNEKYADIFSLRPYENNKMVLNACEEKSKDGTKIIVWTHENLDAPNHCEFRFIPTNAPKYSVESAYGFTDIKEGVYYEDAVVWALKNGVTAGRTPDLFDPYATCTRGEVVTFLWNANGKPQPKYASNIFEDISPADYYYNAVLWAVENGIVSGTGETTFSPQDLCTGGQVITFLWRSNGSPNKTQQNEYYTDAFNWGNELGLLSGTDVAFAPNNSSPRADIVTYIYRSYKK